MSFEIFWLCFVPLFIAVDAIGLIPIFLSLTSGIAVHQRHRIIVTSVITAMFVALSFLFLGKAILLQLGITVADFMIAGGFVLFLISLRDLLTDEPLAKASVQTLGPVPLGVPLIAGPAVLTTIMLLAGEYGMVNTASAVIANISIAGIVFYLSGWLIKLIGDSGSKIIAKVANLFLASIAVMMIRKGLTELLQNGPK